MSNAAADLVKTKNIWREVVFSPPEKKPSIVEIEHVFGESF